MMSVVILQNKNYSDFLLYATKYLLPKLFAFMDKNLASFYTVFLNNLPLFNEYVLTFQII